MTKSKLSNECMFSGDEPSNEEHVIPRWLQTRFNLYTEKLCIPNGTEIQYRYVKVPVCEKHNSAFGVIENNISNGILEPNEVYLWALKIHIGLIYRDASLKFDRSLPNSPTILDVNDFNTEVMLFRQLYNLWLNKGTTSPSPFGSVFIVDSLMESTQFDFIHCLQSGTIAINLGDKFILVFLWDQADALNSNILPTWKKYHSKLPTLESSPYKKRDIAYMAHHVWACESAYLLYKNRRPFNFLQTKNQLILIPPLTRPTGRPPVAEEYAIFCRAFGLKLEEYNQMISNKYSPIFVEN